MATSKTGRTSRLHPSAFVPSVVEISSVEDLQKVPGLQAVISYWNHGAPVPEWMSAVTAERGNIGTYLRRGEDVLGFLVHCPAGFLPRLEDYPLGSVHPDTEMLVYVEGDTRTCKRLMVRMLRGFKSSGTSRVECFASDFGVARHVSSNFLLETGWNPVHSGWRRGGLFTRLGLDLGSTIENGEFARGLLDRVRLPAIGGIGPATVPVPTMPGSFNRAGDNLSRSEDNHREG